MKQKKWVLGMILAAAFIAAVPTGIYGATVVGHGYFAEKVEIPNPWADASSLKVEIPNPWVDASSLAEAEQKAGFDITVPETLFTEFTNVTYRVLPDKMIEVIYRKADSGIDYTEEIRVRKAKGSGDISGDDTEYTKTETVPVGDIRLVQKGDGNDMVKTETWETGGYSYSVNTFTPMDHDTMAKFVQLVK